MFVAHMRQTGPQATSQYHLSYLLNSGPLRHVLHCPKSLCDEGGYQIVNIVNMFSLFPLLNKEFRKCIRCDEWFLE